MFDAIKDIQKLTTIPGTTLDKVIDLIKDSICSDILEVIDNGQQTCNVDIGIGNIQLLFCDECIKYKFIPSQSLESRLRDTISTGIDPIEKRLENKITEKLVGAYKEML